MITIYVLTGNASVLHKEGLTKADYNLRAGDKGRKSYLVQLHQFNSSKFFCLEKNKNKDVNLT